MLMLMLIITSQSSPKLKLKNYHNLVYYIISIDGELQNSEIQIVKIYSTAGIYMSTQVWGGVLIHRRQLPRATA